MAIPAGAGINFNVKPYVDDGSSLPSVVGPVQLLSDTIVAQGNVTATSVGPPRTITLNGWQATLVTVGTSIGATGRQWQFTTLTGLTDLWQNWTYAAPNSSIFWQNKSST